MVVRYSDNHLNTRPFGDQATSTIKIDDWSNIQIPTVLASLAGV